MSIRYLNSLSIDELRRILGEINPGENLYSRGITSKVLVKRILLLTPSNAQEYNYQQKKNKRLDMFTILIRDLNLYINKPIYLYTDFDREVASKLVTKLYEDYKVGLTDCILSKRKFLYGLTILAECPIADAKSLTKYVDQLKLISKTLYGKKVALETMASCLGQVYSSLARLEEVVGVLVSRYNLELDEERNNKIKKDIQKLPQLTALKFSLVMTSLYDRYKGIATDVYSYHTFLGQFAMEYRNSKSVDLILSSIANGNVMRCSGKKLLRLYGKHAYDKNLLGKLTLDINITFNYIVIVYRNGELSSLKVLGSYTRLSVAKKRISTIYKIPYNEVTKNNTVGKDTILIKKSIIGD